jgi:hypothetical protein
VTTQRLLPLCGGISPERTPSFILLGSHLVEAVGFIMVRRIGFLSEGTPMVKESGQLVGERVDGLTDLGVVAACRRRLRCDAPNERVPGGLGRRLRCDR